MGLSPVVEDQCIHCGADIVRPRSKTPLCESCFEKLPPDEPNAPKVDGDLTPAQGVVLDRIFARKDDPPVIGAYLGVNLGSAKAMYALRLLITDGIGDPAILTVLGRQVAVHRLHLRRMSCDFDGDADNT